MGNAYVRQSAADIVSSAEIQATPLNAEFNALRDAFDSSAGHSHDGTTGESQKISLTTSISGVLPIVNGGIGGINNLSAVTNPTVGDDTADGYVIGSTWINTATDVVYVATDVTLGAAVWQQQASGSFQPLDATLTALAGVTTAADKLIYATGLDTFTTADLTTFMRTVLDDTTSSAARTTLGVAVGTNVQAWDADLDALAALSGTNNIYYRSAANTWTSVTIGAGLTFSAGTLNTATLDPELSALAGLTSAADQLPYFTGSGTAALTTLTSAARTVLDDTTVGAMLTTLGGQPLDAELTAIAGLTSAANKGITFTGSGTAATYDLTATALTLLDDTSTSAMLTTLGAAPLASPALAGTPTAPTAAAGTSTTQLATTAFVQQEIAGRTEIYIDASAFVPPSTNGAQPSVLNVSTTPALTIAFDTTTQEFAVAKVALPKRYNDSTVTYKAYWTFSSGSGGVTWSVDAFAASDGDTLGGTYGTEQIIADTALTASQLHITGESPALTIAGTPADEDMIFFRVKRNVADANDTLATDAYFLGLKVFITTNKGTDV